VGDGEVGRRTSTKARIGPQSMRLRRVVEDRSPQCSMLTTTTTRVKFQWRDSDDRYLANSHLWCTSGRLGPLKLINDTDKFYQQPGMSPYLRLGQGTLEKQMWIDATRGARHFVDTEAPYSGTVYKEKQVPCTRNLDNSRSDEVNAP